MKASTKKTNTKAGVVSQHSTKYISLKGVKQNNLKNIDVDIPRNKLVVITGVSGSGKSSLAFDTIYAEGQRRFVESLSAYVRQFLERMPKPDAESITGLPPAVAIKQSSPQKNPRSTVGTTTEIYDYLRVLFGRIGVTYDRVTGNIIKKDTPDSVTAEVLTYNEKDKIYVMFPFVEENLYSAAELESLKSQGFHRIYDRMKDEIIEFNSVADLVGRDADSLYVLVDRLAIRRKDKDMLSRLTDSIETGFRIGKGRIAIWNLTEQKFKAFSSIYEDSESGIVYVEPDPKLFSFNSPQGACPNCQGFGRTVGLDEDLVFPDRSLTINRGGIAPFKNAQSMPMIANYKYHLTGKQISLDVPISGLTDEQIALIMDGFGQYPGVTGFFNMLEEKSYKMNYRVILSKFRSFTTCKACGGSRLRTSARQVYVGGKNIPEIINLPLDKLLDFFKNIKLSDYQYKVAEQLLKEIVWRIQLLVDIGLEYLTLSRLTHTLSGGEAQRISLSSALGSSLVGTLYVLDEPSIGMHARDTDKLLKILFKLRNLGNTIIVVEHDPDIMQAADHIIDIGPNAGEYGGELIHSGNVKDLMKNKRSITGEYLSGKKELATNQKRNQGTGKKLIVQKPRENNLKMPAVEIPLGCMVAITGVSGSGKSSLVHNVIYGGLKRIIGGYTGYAGKYDKFIGYTAIEAVEMVDQSAIGRSSRSTPVSYIKAFDGIREVFAQTQLAKQLGLKPGYFSFNVPGGRCEVCEGEGFITVDMQFLPDVSLECEACGGTRYKKEAQNIHYNNKSIVDVLNMTVDESFVFFEDVPRVSRKLRILSDVGLGYLKLGQPSTMLSGGEAQRIKLAGHLDSRSDGDTLFIFDEPTTGLHFDDIAKLLNCFRRLIYEGNSVLIIEHNIQLIAAADWLIDLGPEAGERGGEIVDTGTPEKLAKNNKSYTGIALKEFFEQTRLIV